MNSTSINYEGKVEPVITATSRNEVKSLNTEPGTSISNETQPGKTLRWLNYVDKRLAMLGEIDSVSHLESSYPAPGEELIDRARAVAWSYFRAETPTPNVVPTAEGGVAFVWFKGDWHLEINIDSKEESVWAHNLSSGMLWQGPLSENLPKLRNLLDELAGVP